MASVYTTLSPLHKVKLFIVLYLIILILLPVKLLQEPFDIWPIGTYNPKVIMRNIFFSCPSANVGITPLLVVATENLIAMIKWDVIRLIGQIQSASFANGDMSLLPYICKMWILVCNPRDVVGIDVIAHCRELHPWGINPALSRGLFLQSQQDAHTELQSMQYCRHWHHRRELRPQGIDPALSRGQDCQSSISTLSLFQYQLALHSKFRHWSFGSNSMLVYLLWCGRVQWPWSPWFDQS